MAPKKAAGAPAAKKASTSSHPPYADMIKEAIINLKERTGSSRQSIKKYVQANNNLKAVSDAAFTSQFNKALQKGSETGTFLRPKGPSGPVKLGAGSKAAKSTTAKKTTAAAAKPKAAATKKAPAAKKTASATKKAPAAKKATATKSKANTGKARKTATAAPAVVDKAPVVVGKTKSGRVTKSKAPQPEKKAAAKKAPAKKAAPKKAAA